ncbi:MAG: hypothetical protein RL247_616, partial [Actinomycetota bacterium]
MGDPDIATLVVHHAAYVAALKDAGVEV